MKKEIFRSFTAPRALLSLALLAVAGAAHAFGFDVAAGASALGMLAVTGEMDVKNFEAVQAALKKIDDQVKEAGEKALAEAAKGIDMSKSAKEKADEALTQQAKLRDDLAAIKAQQLELEQTLAKRPGADAEQSLKSMGFQLIEGKGFQEQVDKFKTQRKGSMAFQVKAITSANGSAGQAVYPDNRPGVNQVPNRRLTIRDLIAPGRTNSNLVNYIKESGYTNSAAIVAEGTRKPESDIDYTVTPAPVRKIAHFIKATTEILDDFPALQSQIDERLRYMLDFVEEAQLLKGSGSGNNLNGIYTQATAYAAPIVISGATKIDTLRLMHLQAELAEYFSDAQVMHPSDWASIELLKDSEGRYIIGNPQGSLQPTLWGRPVVATQAMTVDTALVGAFRLASQIFDREDAGIVIATENEDDFVNNLVTILIERRLALAVYRPEAFIKNTNFDGSV